MAHDGRERERRRGKKRKAAQHLEGDKLTAAFRIWEQSGLKGLRTEINNTGAADKSAVAANVSQAFCHVAVRLPWTRAAPRSPAASGWRRPCPPLPDTPPGTSTG